MPTNATISPPVTETPDASAAAVCPVHAVRAAADGAGVPVAPPVRGISFVRWLLVVLGLLSVGIGAIGVFVPGLPTTIFLMAAVACFTRSCPVLERVLITDNALFRPFLQYLQPGTPMPVRAKVVALVAMWIAVLVSSVMLVLAESHLAIIATVLAAACLGSWVIVRVLPKAS